MKITVIGTLLAASFGRLKEEHRNKDINMLLMFIVEICIYEMGSFIHYVMSKLHKCGGV